MKRFNLSIVLALSALAFVQLVDAELENFDGTSPSASEFEGGDDFKSQPGANIDNDDNDFDDTYKTKLDDTDAEPEDFGFRPSGLQDNIQENDGPEEGLNGSLSGMRDEQFPSDLYNDGNGTPEVDDIDSVSGLSPSMDDENPAFYGASDSETAFGSSDDYKNGLTQQAFKAEEENSMSENLGSHPIPPPLSPIHPAASLPTETAKPSGFAKSSSAKAPAIQQAPASKKRKSDAKPVKTLKKAKIALPAKSHAPVHKAQGKESKKPKKPAGKPVTLKQPIAKKGLIKKGEKKVGKKTKGANPKASKAKASGKPKGKKLSYK